MTAKLSGNALTLIRGERCLFEDLSFALNPGELLLLEGQNGSGKTSLLRAMAGLLSLESGDVRWNDVPVLEQRQDYHAETVWLGHRSGLKSDLTMLENLRFEACLRPQSGKDSDEVFDRLGIRHLRKLPVRSLSAGQQRRVALARLLLADVPLWLMDEPFTNLDRDGRTLVMELV
ncbi:MAG: cytochrome c biogenesis heme-transporting ATPase CcmA, partial [Pseudomonadota bacterium]